MKFARENSIFFLLFIITGALLFSALGIFIAGFFPALSVLKTSLVSIGFDLDFLALTVRLNILSIVGVIIGIIIFAKA